MEMNEGKAREILGNHIEENENLSSYDIYIKWNKSFPDYVKIDDAVSIDFLEAVIWWMKNKR
jgi:hypothetical protein